MKTKSRFIVTLMFLLLLTGCFGDDSAEQQKKIDTYSQTAKDITSLTYALIPREELTQRLRGLSSSIDPTLFGSRFDTSDNTVYDTYYKADHIYDLQYELIDVLPKELDADEDRWMIYVISDVTYVFSPPEGVATDDYPKDEQKTVDRYIFEKGKLIDVKVY